MLSRVYIYFLFLNLAYGQIDGEFWWLSDKFASLAGSRPPPPKFEDLSVHDNDENAKIIFRDDNLLESKEITENISLNEIDENKDIYEKTVHSIIKWPDEDKIFNGDDIIDTNAKEKLSEDETSSAGDKFTFKFPENDNLFVWKDSLNTTTETSLISASSTVMYNDKVSFNLRFEEKQAENICTFMKKSDCYQLKGILNFKEDKKQNLNQQLICCILPLKNKNDDDAPKIYFPDSTKKNKRLKRSDDVAQRQRNILLQRKYAHQIHKAKPSIQTKIASPDYEYDDPYWNIKNVKNPNKRKEESNTRYDQLDTEEYGEDYAVEVPRPGLTGLYSDNGKRPPGWTFSSQSKGPSYGGDDDYEDDTSVAGFGYSTIDPRFGSETTRKNRFRAKPSNKVFTVTSEEVAFDAESQTISYHSNPDFNALQDFKLLNLLRNKSKQKIARSTTTESFSDDDSKEFLSGPFDESSEANSDDFEDRQIFKGCGKAAKPISLKNKGKQIGDTENGSHPWLALLVPTRQLNSVLCYSSLIHPRAAVSAADCVHRTSPGEITILAGIWNLNERSRLKSRVISTFIHPKYKNGGLNNNLAILHWKRPLKLGINVQPACLANPHLNDECMFVGWGGFDQAIRPRSRWQRASVHTCKDSLSLNGVNVPSDAFCASVKARGTVTGIGGSLICTVNGHLSAVGVAVSRDSTLVLLPLHDWLIETIGVINE